MFMRNLLIIYLLTAYPAVFAQQPTSPGLGIAVDKATVESWNLDIFPDGKGLPPGSGTAVAGKAVYEQYCQLCHGIEGSGASADELAGAAHSLTDDPPDKTIGTYWPYATTLFDFTRRSMPLTQPGVLTNDQLYAVTAYLLYLNGIISQHTVINASTLPKVKMPNSDGFINVYTESQ